MGVSTVPSPGKARVDSFLRYVPTSVLPTFWPLTNSAALMVVVSVSCPGLPERDFAVGSEPSSVKRTVAGLIPGVILTVTESTKSSGLG